MSAQPQTHDTNGKEIKSGLLCPGGSLKVVCAGGSPLLLISRQDLTGFPLDSLLNVQGWRENASNHF